MGENTTPIKFKVNQISAQITQNRTEANGCIGNINLKIRIFHLI